MRYFTWLLILCTAVVCSQRAFAQETTATLSGLVTDSKGSPVDGASVIVKHEPTGYSTGIQTNSKGIFVIPNLKPGGPYTIRISFTGFKEQVLENVNLTLGNNPDFKLSLGADDNNLKEVVVTGNRKVGSSGFNVGKAQLTTLPTLGRSLQDFTRLTPQSNNNSFAGTNFRYNNITLDGAVNNDAIGFSNSFGGVSGGGQSGTAGSGTRTNPYSLDVIQEVQVQLSPYDVKLGNFTGGSVNAVTKSGGNTFHGSLYAYGRNQTLVGKSPDGAKSKIGSDFYDYQYGGTLSGPIIKNKLFFIVNGEITRRQEPTFYNAGDPGSISIADAQRVATAFKAAGFDPGSYDRYKIFSNSDKFFGRIDYNIDQNNSLMVRAIYTYGRGNNLERTNTTFQFSSTDFTQHTKNLNLVAELKSKLSNSVSNNLVLSYINVHDYRDFPNATPSPYADITAGSTNIWVGTWREASIYNTKQKTFEITDNVTWTKGINKFTFGTHNEFYDFTYGFINSWNGRWQYSSLANFEQNKPSRIRGTFAIDNAKNNFNDLQNNTPGAKYNVGLLSAYVQDEIAVTPRFKVTPGVRFDYSYVGSQPPMDNAINAVPEYTSANPTYTHTPFAQLNNKWFGKGTISPRLGFNWDINGNQSVVLRGGTGIFTGRIPFAWLGYAYTLNGHDYGNIDWNSIPSGTVVPLAKPEDLKTVVDAASGNNNNTKTRELDLIDNNFKLPTIWRSSLAVDFKFGNGYKLTVDGLYTKTIYDVKFQQINVKDQTAYYTSGPTQSPVYTGGKMSSDYSAIFFLTNTKEGYRYNLTAQLSKVTNNLRLGKTATLNFNWSVAYTYGMSKDVSNGIRNSFGSNYEYNPAITPNNSMLGYSNFDLRHRIVAFAGTSWNWNETNTTSLSFVYSGQSGSPYSLVYTSVPYGTGSSAAIPYIPKDQSDINLRDNGTYTAAQQWTDLNALIEGDSYLKTRRGKYAERNALRTPWNHTLDLKLMHEFRLSKTNRQHTLAISLDIFNVLNLLNNDWGHITFVTNTNNYTVNFLKFVADASGKNPGAPSTGYTPSFQYLKPTGVDNKYYTVDPINSRWQGQLGIKYTF